MIAGNLPVATAADDLMQQCLAAQFAAQQSSWLKTIGPTLAKLKWNFYPANLQVIEDLEFEQVEEVVMLDGLGLYGLPRTELAEKLIRAGTTSARREVLGVGGRQSRWTAGQRWKVAARPPSRHMSLS